MTDTPNIAKMNDVEADAQVNQMVNFILKEARDTAEGLTGKANEDFNIEKLKLVQSMKDEIRADYNKKKKGVETKQAIERSTAINKARLKKIEARQQCIEKLGTEVADKLKEVSKAEAKYKQILVDLIVQGSLKLMEEDITVKCRAADAAIVRGVLDQASQAFTKVVAKVAQVNAKLKLTMDKENLPATCLGGVVLSCQGGSISVDNTLDTRMKLCMDNDKPMLRQMLFPGR